MIDMTSSALDRASASRHQGFVWPLHCCDTQKMLHFCLFKAGKGKVTDICQAIKPL
jgi:hypothetical protein